ncbi:MAG TPA: ABC transporter permease [Tepidiformaceae bacterium]
MTLGKPAVQPGASASRPALEAPSFLWAVISFFDKTLTIADLEVRKLRHDPTELLTRAVQPALWLLVFGEVLAKTKAIPSGNLSYRAFLAPGILAQSVSFIAIFYGIAVIWERDLGIVHKFLVSPTPRAALVLGKAVSASIRGLAQGVIVYVIAILMGVEMNWSIGALLGVVALVFLGGSLFATFSLIIACLVRTRERFMGIGQVLTMPLFFASSAIYPISIMPRWLQVVAHGNPLTYQVDGLRALMPRGGSSQFGLGLDFVVLSGVMLLLVLIGSRLYPRVAQ